MSYEDAQQEGGAEPPPCVAVSDLHWKFQHGSCLREHASGGGRSPLSLGVEVDTHIQHALENMKRTTIIFSLGLFALILVVLLITRSSPEARGLSQAEFTTLVQSNLLAKVRLYYPPKPGQVDGVPVMLHEVRGTFCQTDRRGQILKERGIPMESPFIARVQLTDELESELTRSTNFAVVSPNPLVQKVSGWFSHSK